MTPFRSLGLLTKINLIIAGILVVFFALSTWINYRQQRALTIEEAVEKSRIVAFEAIRAREYLSASCKDGEVPLSPQRYGLIPVVASNRIGQLVAKDLDYRIRQVSDRYRNPQNAPDAFEAQVLERFRSTPGCARTTPSPGSTANRSSAICRPSPPTPAAWSATAPGRTPRTSSRNFSRPTRTGPTTTGSAK